MTGVNESTLDYTLGFTALLNIDPEFGRMEATAAEAMVAELVQAYRDQQEPGSMWSFARRWAEQRQEVSP